MYAYILAVHSLMRWLVLAGVLLALYRAYKGWLSKAPYTAFDNRLRHYSATAAHIQLVLGLWLYVISPVTTYFLHHFNEAVHDRELRFFGMEHITMMLLAIIVITITSILSKRRQNDTAKFKTWALGYTLALLIIISSVPWPFSPVVSRPWIRFWF